ncbi:MAG: hypothetical protein L6422_10885 [Candidatus Marinimicrobia bacterium]|nr:hypothetical protein [Candidatus Neomarinimicrobiota bacterium]
MHRIYRQRARPDRIGKQFQSNSLSEEKGNYRQDRKTDIQAIAEKRRADENQRHKQCAQAVEAHYNQLDKPPDRQKYGGTNI